MLGKTFLAAATALAGFTALPSAASAGHDPYYDRGGYDDGYYNDDYDDRRSYRRGGGYRRGYDGYGYRRYRRGDRYVARCSEGTTGAIIGGVTGALLGREIGRSGRRGYYRRGRGGGTGGAIVGGAVGAMIGRDIDSRC